MADIRLAAREKQIAFGKNTAEYRRLLEEGQREGVPDIVHRRLVLGPNIHKDCSKRSFDGLVSQWRRSLHQYYDPPPSVKSATKR